MKPSEIRLNLEQLRLLSSPTRLGIYTSLRVDGPASARELAQRLGGDELSLYYHLRLLAKHGVVWTETRPTATKREAVYVAHGPLIVEDLDLNDAEVRRELQRNLESLLKAAGREFGAAADQLRQDFHDLNMVGRLPVRLSPEDGAEFQKRLQELTRWLNEKGSVDGERFGFTFVFCPIVQKSP